MLLRGKERGAGGGGGGRKEGRKDGRKGWRERTLTRNCKEHDLLVSPFFRCVVIHWDAAGCDAGFFFGVWHVAVVRGEGRVVSGTYSCTNLCSGEWGRDERDVRGSICTYENTTLSGKLSPCLRAVMVWALGWVMRA